MGAGHLAAVLSQFNKEDQMRVVGDLSLADLRRSPTILVDASLSLARAFANQYRFLIEEKDGERMIREQAPPYRSWRIFAAVDGAHTEDYGLATRVFDSEPG